MGNRYAKARIFQGDQLRKVTVVANGELTANCPVGIYRDADGVLTGIKVAVDANSVNWGIAPATIADTASGEVIINGPVTLASGGTSGQLITAISNAGVITDAAAANTNADINILGTSTGAAAAIIY